MAEATRSGGTGDKALLRAKGMRAAGIFAAVVGVHAAVLTVRGNPSEAMPVAPHPQSLIYMELLGTGPRDGVKAGKPPDNATAVSLDARSGDAPTSSRRPTAAVERGESMAVPGTDADHSVEDYVDARDLTLRPALMSLVDLPEPAPGSADASSAVFTLFVNREGRVTNIRVESSTLPDLVEMESKQAFFGARFRPGMLGDRPVASRMRIEIHVDAQTAEPASTGGTSPTATVS